MTVLRTGRPVSIIQNPELTYPEPADYFSPDEAFPEYQMRHIAKKPNPVYKAVRQCLAGAGLDKENFGKPTWNPLREYISPGQKIFVLCNFVQHNLKRDARIMLGKCTHGSVIRPIIDYVLLALGGRGAVSFGNAPLQSCDWARVIEETGAAKVQEFYRSFCGSEVQVNLRDLRQQIIRPNAVGRPGTIFYGKDTEFYEPVDLGPSSLLDELYQSEADPEFRVLDYDPRRTMSCHGKGKHVYFISKHVLECDVLVSIPKLKTHARVGMTCGTKGCVGTVAQKDCLAHHRYGPPRAGGDDYPDAFFFLKPLSSLHDFVYTREPGHVTDALYLLNYYARRLARRFTQSMGGAWPGNDTCWRMALDIARIMEYANKQGQLQRETQRIHIMFTDGIVGGERNGPLSPRPVSFGYLSFSDNVALGDYVNCLAIGFDPKKIPIVWEAFAVEPHRLACGETLQTRVHKNGELIGIDALRNGLGRKFLPPREWRGSI